MRSQNRKALEQILRANSKIQILQMGSMPLNTTHAAIGTIAMAPKPPDELAGIEDRSQYRVALMQRLKAIRGVIVRTDIAKQGLPTGRGVAVTTSVGRQSLIAIGCVIAPYAVVVQRRRTRGRVLGSGRIIKKCDSTDGRIVVGSGVLRERGNAYGGVIIAGSIFC